MAVSGRGAKAEPFGDFWMESAHRRTRLAGRDLQNFRLRTRNAPHTRSGIRQSSPRRPASPGNLEYAGVVTDITERKRTDDEREALYRSLQESKARLEEAQSVAHVGYWDWDLETGEIIWSDETYRIFGFKPQERRMDIETVSGLVHPDDREALYSTVDEEVAVGVHPVHQHRIVRPSGEVRNVQSNAGIYFACDLACKE